MLHKRSAIMPVETIYTTVFKTADDALREARAFLDAPTPPDRERWEVIMYLDSEARDVRKKEHQKYLESVHPYIIDKLDHLWPDHLRVLEAGSHFERPEDWLLGRTLSISPEALRHPRLYHVPKKFFLQKPFASYTGLILEKIDPEIVDTLISRVTERYFDAISFLAISFERDSIIDEKSEKHDFERMANALLGQWARNLARLHIAYPMYYDQVRVRAALLDAITEHADNMTSLEHLELEGFCADSSEDFEQFFALLHKLEIKKLGLSESLENERLLELLASRPALFEHYEEILLDGIKPELYGAFLHHEALGHLKEKRFFKEVHAESWEDTSYKLAADIEMSRVRDGELSGETLFRERLDLDMMGDFDRDMLLALFQDPEDPRIIERVEEISARYLDEEALSLFLQGAPRAFPNLRKLELERVARIKRPRKLHPWPSLTELVYTEDNAELSRFVGPDSFPSLKRLTLYGARKKSWMLPLEHPEYFPALEHLHVSSGFGRNHWFEFYSNLRSNPLLAQLQTIVLDFSAPNVKPGLIEDWIEDILDESIPLIFRRYVYTKLWSISGSGALLAEIFRALDEPWDFDAPTKKLSAQFLARFPEEVKAPLTDEEVLDISDVTRF